MKHKNPSAVALGRLARGVPKKYSAAELARRTKRVKEGWMRARRKRIAEQAKFHKALEQTYGPKKGKQ